jgi:hypothetical protein
VNEGPCGQVTYCNPPADGCGRVCTGVYGCVRVCTGVYGCVRVCTGVYGCKCKHASARRIIYDPSANICVQTVPA